MRLYGRPVEWRSRVAAAMVGGVQWELIQPLDDNALFARSLAERGGAVHHIAVVTYAKRTPILMLPIGADARQNGQAKESCAANSTASAPVLP